MITRLSFFLLQIEPILTHIMFHVSPKITIASANQGMGSHEDTHWPLTTLGKKIENNRKTVSWGFGFIDAGAME